MIRLSALQLIAINATIGIAVGCGEVPAEDVVETVTSGLTTVSSNIRGYTRSDGLHGVVYRDDLGNLLERTGTPLGGAAALGAQSGGAPWAYKRTDNVNAYLYISTPNRHIHEITKVGNNFIDIDFTTQFGINAPTAALQPGNGPLPDVVGYVRSDGKNAIVYRSDDINRVNHIIEITSNFSGSPPWLVSDLTQASSGPAATTGSAFPYVRSDNVNAIVYIAGDGHIHEIGSNSPGPTDADLFVASGVPTTVTASTDPWGYKRADGINAVVFVGSDGQLRELSLQVGTPCWTGLPWCSGVIHVAVSPTGGLFRRPSGYVRADSKSAVVYVSGTNSLHEVSLAAGGMWVDGTLPIGSGVTPVGQPFGHKAPGDRSSVLFQGNSSFGLQGNELSLPVGGNWGLQTF